MIGNNPANRECIVSHILFNKKTKILFSFHFMALDERVKRIESSFSDTSCPSGPFRRPFDHENGLFELMDVHLYATDMSEMNLETETLSYSLYSMLMPSAAAKKETQGLLSQMISLGLFGVRTKKGDGWEKKLRNQRSLYCRVAHQCLKSFSRSHKNVTRAEAQHYFHISPLMALCSGVLISDVL